MKTRKGRRKRKQTRKKLMKYEELSPFELKNTLIRFAKMKNPLKMLNAGRGNPNFFNGDSISIFHKM